MPLCRISWATQENIQNAAERLTRRRSRRRQIKPRAQTERPAHGRKTPKPLHCFVSTCWPKKFPHRSCFAHIDLFPRIQLGRMCKVIEAVNRRGLFFHQISYSALSLQAGLWIPATTEALIEGDQEDGGVGVSCTWTVTTTVCLQRTLSGEPSVQKR